eukprot:CAMPEP_0197040236 /NCGR_PEP_ID=MMETSP1384-20130603/16977_1 /TAXON_ID=29189 /ORGANISM="Ammonia sp." /LENGTH=196 /DNA_ID=CAMNT_0042470965 /DNA_START=20 /DNA_END=607 /DNA_ORIENTATION=-
MAQQRSRSSSSPKDATQAQLTVPKIGDVVLLQKTIACVMYIGPVHWTADSKALFVGLELPEPIPNGHSGTYDNHKYFECREKHGIILPLTSVVKVISPQELLGKLNTFKSQLKQLNDENEKIKQQIHELAATNDNNDAHGDEKKTEIVITKDLNFQQEAQANGANAELHGLLLEKNGETYKVQLRNTKGKLTENII